MIFSMQKLINTLTKIITGSPTSILFIVLGIIFTIAMIINIKKNKTIGKTLFIIGWIFIILFIIIKYNNYISKIFDNLINNVFMQIFFPNIATYLIIIIITNIIFLITILNKESKTSDKIINSIFFTIIMVIMIITIEQIAKNNVNVYAQEEVYTNENILTLIESTTIFFGIWISIILSKLILSKLINKSNEKIKKEFQEKEQTPTEIKETNNQIQETEETFEYNNIPNTISNEINEVVPEPTMIPTMESTFEPTMVPTMESTFEPTMIPTMESTFEPTMIPTMESTFEPTMMPTMESTFEPTMMPTMESTFEPTMMPTMESTFEPTMMPTMENTFEPTMVPTMESTFEPTMMPTMEIQNNEIQKTSNVEYPQYNQISPENIFFQNYNEIETRKNEDKGEIETLKI